MIPRTLVDGLVVLFVVSSLAPEPLEAVEFLRGDVNSDGEVTISDGHAMLAYLFLGIHPPDCAEAWDWNGNGKLDDVDAIFPLVYLHANSLGSPPLARPAQPFPEKGSAEALLGCREYGVGSPLADPVARLVVVSAVTPGGDYGYATIVLAASHSTGIAGHSFEIHVSGEILAGLHGSGTDLTGELEKGGSGGFGASRWLDSNTLRSGFLASLIPPENSIPASRELAPVYELVVCLRAGTTAGDYPILLEAGEFVDAASGRAIEPELVGGTLTVEEDVRVSSECPQLPSRPDPAPDPPPQPYEFLFEFGTPEATKVASPEAVLADSRGRIIVAKGPGWGIPVFDSEGKLLFEIPSQDGREFKRVMVDRDRIIVTEPHRVQVFDPEGEFLFAFGKHGLGDGELNYPSTAVDSGGRFIVTSPDSRVQVFDPEGHFLFKFGSGGTSNGEFRTPGTAATDSTGRIIVPDLGNRRMQVFDRDGRFLFKFGREGKGDGEFQFISSVLVDSTDRMIVADRPLYHRVQVFDKTGTFLFKLDWGAPGAWWEYWALPTSVIVTVDRLDRIVLWLGRRLQVFAPDGRSLFDLAVSSKPTAIGADPSSGRILVGTSDAVEVFGPEGGGPLFQLGREARQHDLNSPQAVAVDSADRILAIAREHVLVFDSEGDFLFRFGGRGGDDGEFRSAKGLAVDSLDSIIVADAGNHRIQVFDPEGQFLFAFRSDLDRPHAVAVNSADQIIVADTGTDSIKVFDFLGNRLFGFGKRGDGNGEFHAPIGVAVDGADSIIVADSKNHRIQVFDPRGAFLFTFGEHGREGGLFSGAPLAVGVDHDDRIVVTDTTSHRIQVFDLQGEFLFKFGSGDRGNGEFAQPKGVALDSTDRIIVADTENHRVQVFGLKSEGGLRVSGDCNSDGTLDLSDGICLLGYLFRGNPSELPCGDGTIESPGNRALLDTNGDDVINLSDGIVVFGFLFGGGPAPVLGTECVPMLGCRTVCGEER